MTTRNPMNKPDIAFPAGQADLKVRRSRARAAHDDAESEPISLEERRRLEQDLEALRVQEQNLIAYEMRLREWQAQLDQVQQGTRFMPAPAQRFAAPLPPPAGEMSLQEGWTKLHRARALLEVEQKHLVDDRLALREHEQVLQQREAVLAAREQHWAEQEKQAEAASVEPAVVAATPTRSPFAMAKSMLGMKA